MGAERALDALCSQPQYWMHIGPIWRAFPPHLRGTVYIPTSRGLDRTLTAQGVPWSTDRPPASENPILAAGGNDLTYAKDRPVILMEHGAGQTYLGWDDVAYAGGPNRDRVNLFLHPREQTAILDRTRYPLAQVEVVGCPKLDAHLNVVRPKTKLPNVAFTWHWDAQNGPPEARSAWGHYGRDAIIDVAQWWGTDHVIGHSHPRSGDQRNDYQTVGVHLAPTFEQVIDQADILVFDNTSAAFEFAACDRPVVILNAPWYRREIEHGLRFWEAADIGPQVNDRSELLDALSDAWTSPAVEEARRARIRKVYAHLGTATRRAVSTIMDAYF